MRKQNPDGPPRQSRPDSCIVDEVLAGRTQHAADHRHPLRFPALSTIPLRRLFEVAVPLDVADQTFLLAHLLKALDHLLNTFARSCSYLNHNLNRPSFAAYD